MVDFNDNYTSNAKMTSISNEATGWNKKIQRPQLHGGVYYYKCNCDLTNGLQDDCRNPNCRSSYTKLTKRTCSCGRSLLKDREGKKKEEQKKGVGDGDSCSDDVKESKNPKEKEVKEPTAKEVKEPTVKEVKEPKEKKIIESKIKEPKEIKEDAVKESKENEVKEVKAKKSKEPEEKENKKPKEKEPVESKTVKGKTDKKIMKKRTSLRV